MIIDRVENFKREFYQKRLEKMSDVILNSFKHGSAEYAKNRIMSPEITDPEI